MKPLLFFIAASIIGLTGCNGADESTSATEDKNTLPKEAIELSPEKTTATLKAPDGMKFISHENMTLLADITNLGGGPAYLSVYSDFDFIEKDVAENIAKEDDYLQWTTNQDSRVLASSIEHNYIEHEFSIPQHLTQLLVQVWFYDGRPAISQAITIEKEVSINF
jgi:hypothetical protein